MKRDQNDESSSGRQKAALFHRTSSADRAVLLHSTRHNVQAEAPSEACTQQKSRPRIARVRATPAPKCFGKTIQTAACPSNVQKQGICLHAKGLTRTGSIEDACTTSKVCCSEEEASAMSLEINDLRKQLQNTKLQMAEIVAQSTLLIHDVQRAATKKIADALLQEHLLPAVELCSKEQTRFFDHGHSLAQVQQELKDCRLKLLEMKSELRTTLAEKERLEFFFRSSVQTSLKLQDSLCNQKVVLKLEQLATEDTINKEAAVLVHSAKEESKLLQKQLNEALLSKCQAEQCLNTCIQLLCGVQRDLNTLRISRDQQTQHGSFLELERLRRVRLAEEQVELQWGHLNELQLETSIKWTVLECVWQGATKQIRSQGVERPDGNACLEGAKYSLSRLLKEKDETATLQIPKRFWHDGVTPMKDWNLLATPRATCGRDSGVCAMTSPERAIFYKREAVLRQNLMKSEYEVEILGDRVDELRIVLEKVGSLLECMSKSAVTTQGTRHLMRRIIEQLQQFECEISS